MVRRNSPGAGDFAAMWDRLPRAEQQRLIVQLRAALQALNDADGPNHDHAEGAEAARHQGHHGPGIVTVLNAAARRMPPVSPQQKARQDAAWSRLADGVQAPGPRKGQ